MKIIQIYDTKQNYALMFYNWIKSFNKKGYLLVGMQSKAYSQQMPRYDDVVY